MRNNKQQEIPGTLANQELASTEAARVAHWLQTTATSINSDSNSTQEHCHNRRNSGNDIFDNNSKQQ